MFKNMRKS